MMLGYTLSVYLCPTCGTFRALTGTTECRWCRGPVQDVTPEPTDAELGAALGLDPPLRTGPAPARQSASLAPRQIQQE